MIRPIVFIWGISSFKRFSIVCKDSSELPPSPQKNPKPNQKSKECNQEITYVHSQPMQTFIYSDLHALNWMEFWTTVYMNYQFIQISNHMTNIYTGNKFLMQDTSLTSEKTLFRKDEIQRLKVETKKWGQNEANVSNDKGN